ncbi:MAG TPA: TRAP transporter substrate-binding protein DctP [Methyloceanibacter sp.]|nr:TRAP transporter substrate-binding protein DctP [Methyloceanibacter sp.]
MPRRRAAIGLMAGCLIVALAGPGVPAEPVRLVMPLVYGTHLPGLGEPASRLAKLVKQLSGGALELDLKQPGEGTQPQEILDKVSRGSVDAGFSTASFWAAKIPAAALFAGFPFGLDAKGYVEWFFAGKGRKLYQEMYDQADMNLHVIPCAFGGGEASGWFAKEIRKPEDVKGLRMRGFGLGGRVMSRLGAQTVLVPGDKIGEAFDNREIDGAEFLTPAVDQRQRLQNHAKIVYVPGWHQPETVLELLINKDRWNALDDEQQTVLETACRSMLLTTLAESPRLQAAALAELAKQGVRVETWSDDLARAFRRAWEEVASEESSREPFFRTVLSDLEKFRAGPEPSAPKLPPMPPAP